MHSFVIAAENSGIRIDRFLAHHFQTISRSAIQKWFDTENVRVNDSPIKPSYRLRTGDRVQVVVYETSPESHPIEGWDFPLLPLFEDEFLIAINKPAHMVVHPGAGVFQHTVVHAALHRWPEIASVGNPLRPGIVHRLDRETSGVLLLARTQQSYLRISAKFKERSIEKHYRAAVFGKPKSSQGRIDKPLGRDPGNRKKISTRARKSRAAISLYRVLKNFAYGAVLDVQILTGRTHQIRVHLSSENHPIIGDSKYGGANWNRIPDAATRERLRKAAFFGLHAYSLDFQHPFTQEQVHIQAELPPLWNELS